MDNRVKFYSWLIGLLDSAHLTSLRLASLGDMLKYHNKVMLDTNPQIGNTHCAQSESVSFELFIQKPLKVVNLWGYYILILKKMLNFATREKKGVKNRYETFAQHIDGFDALAHCGLPERGYYRHALPSL